MSRLRQLSLPWSTRDRSVADELAARVAFDAPGKFASVHRAMDPGQMEVVAPRRGAVVADAAGGNQV